MTNDRLARAEEFRKLQQRLADNYANKYSAWQIQGEAAIALADAAANAKAWQAQVDRLKIIIQAAKHLILAAKGPEDGPTDWNETRDRWMDKADVDP